ncbi:hypothetical protein PsorP6_016121 [Peronosclerospora sorghi]|uniref:Uncharacterized protein n=1 Tax=Peronosclerospora sorghi TaxID=230839 RepID=A0ACC0VQZ8_9STRA|nr:hypothetical protein PsorP6_016121 [Peronosclerospora sorghi]
MSASKVKFPLPDDYFPPVFVTPDEIRVYEQRVATIMKNALAEYNLHEAMGAQTEYGSRWTVVGHVEHLTALRDVDPSRAVEVSRIFGRVDGDYRSFLDFFYAVTAQEVFAVHQFLYGYAVDGAVLANIHTKDSCKPHIYMGIKWVCLQPSTLARKRDQCFLEYLVYTRDLQGRDVGVRITLPLTLDACPPLPPKLKTRRVQSHTVTIVRASSDPQSPETTEIFMTHEIDTYKGSTASSMASLKRLMTRLSSMALFADSKRILLHGMLHRRKWTPKKDCTHCTVCHRKFSTTRRRQHCRFCGEVACRRCMTSRDAPLLDESAPATFRTFQVVKTLFCKACMGKVRGYEESKSLTGTESQDESVSDAESVSCFLDKSFQGESIFALTARSSTASLSPEDGTRARSTTRKHKDMSTHDVESEARSIVGLTRNTLSSSCVLEGQSGTKTSVSSSLDAEIETEGTEPVAPLMIDLRHLRTMAGAERVVKEAEEEERRTIRASLAVLLDLKPDGPASNTTKESVSCPKMPLMDETNDEEEDVIEIFDEPSHVVPSSRQIVSSPLDESPIETLFRSSRSSASLDQRLQEQEVLLKCLVMAANSSSGYCPPSARRQF